MEAPFLSSDAAFIWAVQVHANKASGAKMQRGFARIMRPCEHTDVMREANRLGLSAREYSVLVAYARRGKPPGKKDPPEDRATWVKAMDLLHTRLSGKGIVVSVIEAGGQPLA